MINRILSIIIYIGVVILFGYRLEAFAPDTKSTQPKGAYDSGIYPNLFTELLHKKESEVQTRIDAIWKQIFYGDDQSQRIYYPVKPDMAYIKTISDNDIRSEGMSYGMMIAVQMDRKIEFDRLWKWTKTYMQHKDGKRKHYFAWLLQTDGTIMDPNSAPDGEEWIVMALFFASARWENGTGIYHYENEAQTILNAMLNKAESADSDTTITNMFDKSTKQVVFVPVGDASKFTDPSYHVPHFYELWSVWADQNNAFWMEAASTSRIFLRKAVHPKTGLSPDYAHFDGTPMNPPWTRGHEVFRFDAWRVAMNIAVDHVWFARDDWAVTQSNRLLDFFYKEGLDTYANQYTLDGKKLSNIHSPGLTAMNAVTALAATNKKRIEFVQALWDTPIPSGLYRYYDGMLYMLAFLQISGNFRIYDPGVNSSPVQSNQ
jgi:oligosaccharide reducing-end xylanase